MLLHERYFVFLIFAFSKSMCNGDIATELTQRYNDDRMKCEKDGKTKPAYECSGIIMRGVNSNKQLKYPWSLKLSNKVRESFSAAFLRKDTRFDSFPRDYDTGFIIYPHSTTKTNKNAYKVFCAFPVNAHSDGRKGHGCGQSLGDPFGTSRHCDSQGIELFEKWVSRYNEIMHSSNKNFVTRQCAFDMTKETAAGDFALVIQAAAHLRDNSAEYSCRNNELVIHSWNENNPGDLPIEAFFYLIDIPYAYEKASEYQDKYYQNSGGEIVPIVGIRLPTKSSPNIYIEYKDRSPNSEEGNDYMKFVSTFRQQGYWHNGYGLQVHLPNHHNNHQWRWQVHQGPWQSHRVRWQNHGHNHFGHQNNGVVWHLYHRH